MEALTIALFLSVVANRITEYIVKPVKVKFPNLDLWWLIYPTWVVGGVLAWLAGVDLFAAYFPGAGLVGRLLTAVLVGGGSNLIADVFGQRSSLPVNGDFEGVG